MMWTISLKLGPEDCNCRHWPLLGPEPVAVGLSGPSFDENPHHVCDEVKTRPCGLYLQALASRKARASYGHSLGTGFLSGRPESGRSLRKPAPRMVSEALAFPEARACDFRSKPSSSRIRPNEDDLRGTWL